MTATATSFAALLATIDDNPTSPEPVAILGDWFEDHSDVRAGCIQWAVRWGRMPHDGQEAGYYFTALNNGFSWNVLFCFHNKGTCIPYYRVYRASEAWLALCDRWVEMAADEREMVERESERVWGGE